MAGGVSGRSSKDGHLVDDGVVHGVSERVEATGL